MQRTSNRPLVTGELSDREALVFAWALGVASTLWSRLSTQLAGGRRCRLAAILLLRRRSTRMILKRRTAQNIVWGGIAGCFPVLIGWAAVTGSLAWPPFILFGVIFLWTPPHYWPLSMKYRERLRGGRRADARAPSAAARRSGCRSSSTPGRRSPARCCSSRSRHMGLVYTVVGAGLRRLVHLRVAPASTTVPIAARERRADARLPRLDHLPDAALPRGRDRPAAALLSLAGAEGCRACGIRHCLRDPLRRPRTTTAVAPGVCCCSFGGGRSDPQQSWDERPCVRVRKRHRRGRDLGPGLADRRAGWLSQ